MRRVGGAVAGKFNFVVVRCFSRGLDSPAAAVSLESRSSPRARG